jgi:hypothetical protein
MAAGLSGLHVFQTDVGPEALSLLDNNFTPIANALNTLANFANYYVDSGAVNALSFNVAAPQIASAYTDGLLLQVKVGNTTTSTAPTLNVSYLGNPLGAKTIFNPDGSALVAGQMVAGAIVGLQYSIGLGGFQLVSGGVGGSLATGLFANGTAAAPSIAFLNSPGTGLYRAGADILGISTAGAQRGSVNAAGNWALNSPSSGYTLSLNSTNTQILSLSSTGANNGPQVFFTGNNGTGYIGIDAFTNGVLAFGSTGGNPLPINLVTSSAARLTIANAGNVAINAPSSGNALTATGVAGAYAVLIKSASSGTELGLQIQAGSGASDVAFSVQNQASSVNYVTIFGDGHGAIGPSGSLGLSWTTTGQMTISASNTGSEVLIVQSTGSNTGPLATFNSGSATGSYIRYQNGGSDVGFLGAGNRVFSGASTDFAITAVGANNLLLGVNSVNTFKLLGTTAPTIQGYGPTAGGLVDMTPDTGTFTATLTGVVSGSATMSWYRIGKFVILSIAGNLLGTSNATTLTFTGLPAAIQPATMDQNLPTTVIDNGVPLVGQAGVVHGSGTVTFYVGTSGTPANRVGYSSSGFTNSGNKGLSSWSLAYSIL